MRRPRWTDLREVRRWLTLRCEHCGHRFRWKRDSRHSFGGNHAVYHGPCIAYVSWRRRAEERMTFIRTLLEVTDMTDDDVKLIASWRDQADLAFRVLYDRDRDRESQGVPASRTDVEDER